MEYCMKEGDRKEGGKTSLEGISFRLLESYENLYQTFRFP